MSLQLSGRQTSSGCTSPWPALRLAGWVTGPSGVGGVSVTVKGEGASGFRREIDLVVI